jgi:hypothetical protein
MNISLLTIEPEETAAPSSEATGCVCQVLAMAAGLIWGGEGGKCMRRVRANV